MRPLEQEGRWGDGEGNAADSWEMSSSKTQNWKITNVLTGMGIGKTKPQTPQPGKTTQLYKTPLPALLKPSPDRLAVRYQVPHSFLDSWIFYGKKDAM